MKKIVLLATLVVISFPFFAATADANTIKRACMKSDRAGVNSALCGCIQKAADATLTRRDQQLASKFFADPHMSQEVRQSDRESHEIFWQKYKNFGQTAQAYCGY
ncbi:hypothetical protein [Parasulfitobacter algicola]|uniref:Uncharacterized protein n=1 Tax=Parasulfitobacter algicola TaxID=2614809 RepID=A0ABX2IU93_9RHOB|nr:hypothetical protein [Sulfitobacter algicola]NSX54412.1 hypothetical protein [Sulfitobacter algicola]